MDQELVNLHKKMEQQIKDRELSLIFQIELNDDEIGLIRANGRAMYEDVKVDRTRCDLQFAYYLVDIGMRYYDDRRYWVQFWDSIGCRHDANKQSMVGEYFVKTLDRYRLLKLDLGGMKYVGNIIAHGFIPNKYSAAFFNFLYSFYNVALRGTVPDDLDHAMYTIAKVFSDPEFAQTYPELRGTRLIKPTCRVLCDESLFGDIVKKMICRIGNSYESIDDVRLGIYEMQFREWAENHDRRKTRDRIGAPPYMECNKESRAFSLIVPPRVVESHDSFLALKSSDGDVLWQHNLIVTEKFGLLLMDDEQSIPLDDPLDEFTVWLGRKCIFSNINDGYVLFNKNGRSHRKVSLGFNLVLARGNPVEGLLSIDYGILSNGANLYGFMMDATDSIQLGGRCFTVEKAIDESIHIVTPAVDVQCRDQDGNTYMLFDRLPTLRIFVNHENCDSSLAVACGMNRIQVQRLGSLRVDGSEDSMEVELNTASSGLIEEAGVYTIMLDKAVKARFLMLPGFKCCFEEPIYRTKKESTFRVTGFDETFHFDTMDGQVQTKPKKIDGAEFIFTFQVPSNRYCIDEQPWKMFGTEMNFRDARGSKLRIYSPTLLLPEINVDGYKRSIESSVKDSNLVFDFSRIAMISDMMEATPDKKSVLTFCCGNMVIFKIRYTADYAIHGRTITRKNAPAGTWATVKDTVTGEDLPFDGEQFIMDDSDDDLVVWEYYDNGFGSDRREAMILKRRIDVVKSCYNDIISESCTGKVVFEPHNLSFDAIYFKNLISTDGMYDPDSDMHMFQRSNPSGDDIAKYRKAYDAVRRVLPNDWNINRLKRRIMRFSSSDPELAIQLCNAYLKKSSSGEIEDIKRMLESRVDSI